ncbi:unnamed protein product [Camellia sinensis]
MELVSAMQSRSCCFPVSLPTTTSGEYLPSLSFIGFSSQRPQTFASKFEDDACQKIDNLAEKNQLDSALVLMITKAWSAGKESNMMKDKVIKYMTSLSDDRLDFCFVDQPLCLLKRFRNESSGRVL